MPRAFPETVRTEVATTSSPACSRCRAAVSRSHSLDRVDAAKTDLIIEGVGTGEEDPADSPIEPAAQVVSRTGDLWVIDEHRLLCGDALAPASYTQLFDEEQARMVFADPPYNVRIDGHVCGLGRIKHREFVMASGEMKHGVFRSVIDLQSAINRFIEEHNMDPKPFTWRADPNEIIAARNRVFQTLESIH